MNTAVGRNSFAGQAATTLGGQAIGRGARSETLGGGNLNAALGRGSMALQDTTTLGGLAQGRFAQAQLLGGRSPTSRSAPTARPGSR